MTRGGGQWHLGGPLSIGLDNLAVGDADVTSVAMGRIVWSTARRAAVFEPGADAISRSVPLSPLSMKIRPGLVPADPGEFGGLHGVFADSLPDGWGSLLVDREAEFRGLRRTDLTPVDRLAIVGAGGMGALTYRPEAAGLTEPDAIDLAGLALAADRVLASAGNPVVADALALRAVLGGSGGARPKIVCQIAEMGNDDALLRPASAPADFAFGHWLVKFPSTEDGPQAAESEYAYALMARAAGIAMPETRLLTARDGRRFFAIRRFDRDVALVAGKPVMRRWHMLSASGGLESDHRKFAFDYAALLAWVAALTRDVRAVEEMFRRAVFNVMAHNRDDHGKQHAALLDIDSRGQWRWRLAPAYDLTPSEGPGGEHSLAVAGRGRHIKASHLSALAAGTLVSRARAGLIMAEVADAIARWPAFADQAGLGEQATARIGRLHELPPLTPPLH